MLRSQSCFHVVQHGQRWVSTCSHYRQNLTVYSSKSGPILASNKLICTVYSLYDDILLSIFLHVHQEDLASYNYDSLRTTQTSPWVLSHVCHNWRALVLSSPCLWKVIYLYTNDYIRNPFGPPLLLEIVLQRSADVELVVTIQADQQQSEPEYTREELDDFLACIHSLIRLLLPTTARWRQLEIASSRDVFKAFAGCSFERLQRVEIYYYWYDDEDKVSITLFRNTTKLVQLALECQYELDIDLPWAGIHTFSTGCGGLLHLSQMHGLQDLHIAENCGYGESLARAMSEWEGLGFFELPLLRTITVSEGTDNRDIYELSRRLRAPSLTTLGLYMWQHLNTNSPAPPPGPPRLPVFDSLDSLVNLSLHFVRFQYIDTISFLKCASSVKNLYLGPNAATPAVIEAIGHGVIPRLQTLCLHFSAWKKYPDAIISMIMCRALNCPPAGPITNLRFARFGPDDKDSEQEDGWNKWLLQKGTALRWEVVRGNVDVQIIERYSYL